MSACASRQTAGPAGKPLAPVLTGLGSVHSKITTRSAETQRFFDQGLALVYAFNHDEAARAFREAARLDPSAPMPHWGLALALAPNINDPMPNTDRELEGYRAIRRAVDLRARATAKEAALIDAMDKRFSADCGKDRSPLNKAYAEAMKSVAARFPDDPDVVTLATDALMNTMPWAYWTKDGHPREGTLDMIASIERVLHRWPDHTGANHLYIHLVEPSSRPQDAIPSAQRLDVLAPNAGHLVHMPSHIYIRVGRYADASEANRRAVAADAEYITQCRAQGMYPLAYHPHNWHFLWIAATMEGKSAEAIRAAAELRKRAAAHPDLMKSKEMVSLQYWWTAPMFANIRFGKWEAALAEPRPSSDYPFAVAIWHYSRGMALLRTGKTSEAGAALAELRKVAATPEFKDFTVFGINTFASLLDIAESSLAGEIEAKQGNVDKAVALLERAVRIEDGLIYNEPPDWHFPPRHALGAVLLNAGRAAEAYTVYSEDLRRNPDNGWALYGLAQAHHALKHDQEAAEAEARLKKAWAGADFPLVASRF